MPIFERPHTAHEKYLCSIVSAGISVVEYRELIKNPKCLCLQCGRVATNAEKLCNPTLL